MKTVYKNGQKYIITDALYESIKNIGLYEADLSTSPIGGQPINGQTAAVPAPGNQQPITGQTPSTVPQGNQQNNQQQNNQVNVKDLYNQSFEIVMGLLKKEKNSPNAIEIIKNTNLDNPKFIKIVKSSVSLMSENQVNSFVNDYKNINQPQNKAEFEDLYSKVKELIVNQMSPDDMETDINLFDNANAIISSIKQVLKTVLTEFEIDVTNEINKKLGTKYETVNITKLIMDNGFPNKEVIEKDLIPYVIDQYKKNYGKVKTNEAAGDNKEVNDDNYYHLVDINNNRIEKPKKTNPYSKEVATLNRDDNRKFAKLIKDWLYNYIIKQINNDFIKKTQEKSSELGNEWIHNIIIKLKQQIKVGVYQTSDLQKVGSIPLSNYSKEDYDEIFNKLKDEISKIKPEDELEDIMKHFFMKSFDIIDKYKSNVNKEESIDSKFHDPIQIENKKVLGKIINEEDENNNKNTIPKSESTKVKSDYITKLEGDIIKFYNEFNISLNMAHNYAKTAKVNKEFLLDIIKNDKVMSAIKARVNSNYSIKKSKDKIFDYSAECGDIISKFVFNEEKMKGDYATSPMDSTYNSNNEIEESVFRIKTLVEEKKEEEEKIAEQVKNSENAGFVYEYFTKYTTLVYESIRYYYEEIDKAYDETFDYKEQHAIVVNASNKIEPLISKFNDFSDQIILINFSLAKKVTKYLRNYIISNFDKLGSDIISNESNDKSLNKYLREFETYMGRKPLYEDIKMCSETYEQLMGKFDELREIIIAFKRGAYKRKFVEGLDYAVFNKPKFFAKIDTNLIDMIKSTNKKNSDIEFLDKILAYNVLYNAYQQFVSKKISHKNRKEIPTENIKYILTEMFEGGKNKFDNAAINGLFPIAIQINSRVGITTLITMFTKIKSITENYNLEQDYDVGGWFNKKPIVIKTKDNHFVGVLSFISTSGIINFMKNISSMKFSSPLNKGKKYI